MSDQIGTNLKSKIIKILNLFLTIYELENPSHNNNNNIDKKKKRKKNKNTKLNEKDIYENIMSSSFQSNNSENNSSGYTSTHLNISSTAELWEYFEFICETKYNFKLKSINS